MRRLTWLAFTVGLGYAIGFRQGGDDANRRMLGLLGQALVDQRTAGTSETLFRGI